jgi:hypothetical protein
VIFLRLFRFALTTIALALTSSGAARAADFSAPPPSSEASWYAPAPSSRDPGFEVRFGGFAHGVGGAEKNTADINLELVTPKFLPALPGWWDILVPRAYLSGMLNTDDRTSSLRAGALWLVPFGERFFGEIYFGGAVHDGSLIGDATHAALGSRTLFNVGGSVGYRFDKHWSAMVTFDHLSNGAGIFHTGFARNVGENNYGLRLSYAF